ncbi:WG repeat-containing protein [Candidatus Avoscillospira sp. LCP25S3_F1]|jgi:hypothetical protein|uniref:WG repeat-containing protein n=1 Tax=Candidatus Avoscillospira sp. LCP25S3_F1 TaxID=3438825 RepID=UPI003F8E3EE5
MTCIKADIQVPCELAYDEVWHSENGLIKVSKDGLWGFINEKGTIAIPIEYDTVSQSNNGLICVEKNGLYGLLDVNGNVLIPCIYEEEFHFRSKNLWGKKDGKYCLLNIAGAHISEDWFDEIWCGYDDLCAVRVGGKWGVVSEITGELLVDISYQQAYPIYGKLIRIKLQGKWGLLHHSGYEILPPIYSDIRESNTGVICVKKDGKWGIVKLSMKEK